MQHYLFFCSFLWWCGCSLESAKVRRVSSWCYVAVEKQNKKQNCGVLQKWLGMTEWMTFFLFPFALRGEKKKKKKPMAQLSLHKFQLQRKKQILTEWNQSCKVSLSNSDAQCAKESKVTCTRRFKHRKERLNPGVTHSFFFFFFNIWKCESVHQ